MSQFYKFLLLAILAVFACVFIMQSDYSLSASIDVVGSAPSLQPYKQILNFDLTFGIVFGSFLLVASLVIVSSTSLTVSEVVPFFVYTFSAMSALLSKHMTLTTIYIELMTISAFFIIVSGSKRIGPAIRYAYIHFLVGSILIIGLACFPINNCNAIHLILIGLLINCACFPFSSWVVDSYPAASLHGTVYLSIFTTKISFLLMLMHTYNLWKDFSEILALCGLVTVIYSIVFTALEQNIRKFLCYNIVGQMGLSIMAGSLLSTSYNAVPSLVLYTIFSLLYQSLLFIVANSLISRSKTDSFNSISSFTSIERICGIIAILAMFGFPGTIGYISKSYVMANIETNVGLITYKHLFKISNIILYMSVGLKFLYYIFIVNGKLDKGAVCHNKSPIIILATMCIILGNPYIPIYKAPEVFDFIYSTQNILAQVVSLLCATLLFIPMCRLFTPRINFKMDIDWVFRALIPHYVSLVGESIACTNMYVTLRLKNLTNLFTTTYFVYVDKFKRVINYSSVSFTSIASLFLMSIILILLCLNH